MFKLRFQVLGRVLVFLIVLSSVCLGDILFSDLDPNTDNFLDLGSTSKQWQDMFLSGTIDLGTNTITDGTFSGDWGFGTGDLTGVGSITATELTVGAVDISSASIVIGTLTLSSSAGGGSIIDSVGEITFGNENLKTTGILKYDNWFGTNGNSIFSYSSVGDVVTASADFISIGYDLGSSPAAKWRDLYLSRVAYVNDVSAAGTITGGNVTSGSDPGHTHTGASLSNIDISGDTNLAVSTPITLTDDTVGITVAKDIVAGVGLSGGEDNVLPGAEADTTLTFDATELDALTWSDSANASNIWKFDVSGQDHNMVAGDGLMTFSTSLAVGAEPNANSIFSVRSSADAATFAGFVEFVTDEVNDIPSGIPGHLVIESYFDPTSSPAYSAIIRNLTTGTTSAWYIASGLFGGCTTSLDITDTFDSYGLQFSNFNNGDIIGPATSDGGKNDFSTNQYALNVLTQGGYDGKTISGYVHPTFYGAKIESRLEGVHDACGVTTNYGAYISTVDNVESQGGHEEIDNYTVYILTMANTNLNGGDNFALYSVSDVPSVLAGKLGVGAVTEPTVELQVTGDATIGDGTNDLVVGSTGDTLWTGSAGLSFAEIYAADVADTLTITGATEPNKVQITSFAVDGVSNNTTPDHTNDHITITKAGIYKCSVSMHIVSGGGGGADNYGYSVYKNNGATEFRNMHGQRDLAGGGGDEGSVSLTGILDLAVNDTIEVWIWNNTNDDDIIIDDINLNLIQIGGT